MDESIFDIDKRVILECLELEFGWIFLTKSILMTDPEIDEFDLILKH